MNRITQEVQKRQAVMKLAIRKGNSFASRMYGVSLSSVKRWRNGTWQSLKEGSHRPYSHPRRHTSEEEMLIRKGMDAAYFRYGWGGQQLTSAPGYGCVCLPLLLNHNLLYHVFFFSPIWATSIYTAE